MENVLQQKVVFQQIGNVNMEDFIADLLERIEKGEVEKENVEMQNYDKLQNFYKSYLIGQDTLITVFVVQADGLLGAQTFVYRNEKVVNALTSPCAP